MVAIPSISVVIPTFNRRIEVERAVRSVFTQTVQPIEVVICDDGSTDGTAEFVESLNGPIEIVYLRQENSGLPASARNSGISRSRGDFVAFLDSDDWWLPEKIEEVLSNDLTTYDVVFHPLFKVPCTSRWRHGRISRARQLRSPVHEDLLLRGNVIPNSSAVVRRSVLDWVDGLDESMEVRSWEDFDLWLRISKQTDRFLCIDKVLGNYSTGDGITNPDQSLVNIENFLNRWWDSEQNPPSWLIQQRAIALSALGRHQEAFGDAMSALRHPRSLRFPSDFPLGVGLVARELAKMQRA